MLRSSLGAVMVLVLGTQSVCAQPAGTVAPAEVKGTYLGVIVSPVPEVLYEHLGVLPRGEGVVVARILADSPAAQANLRKHDILISYDSKPITGCEHFAKLIRSDKRDRKVKLGLVRNGRETTADVTLSLGPVLTIAAASKPDDKKNAEVPRGLLKPGAPARVSVAVTPLAKDNLNIIIEYEKEGTGKHGELKCTGNRAEIDKQVRQLPARVQDLTRAALTRFYESQKK